ncbi:hypothetical protein ACYPKM_03395 [Pseudomonas aeruginosa]
MTDTQHNCSVVSSEGQEPFPLRISVESLQAEPWSIDVCPLEHWRSWSDDAELEHKLSREGLIAHGRDAYLVCREMNARFKGETLVVDDTNSIELLQKLFGDVSVTMAFAIKEASPLRAA